MAMECEYVQYYVEGENEERLISVLKTDLMVIRPGKVQKLNVVERALSNARLMALRPRTVAVLAFDTDTGHVDILKRNVEMLKGCRNVSEIVLVPQVKNLEEELVRACGLRDIRDLLSSRSRQEFKSDLLRVTNLAGKLRERGFDIGRFWSCTPTYPYESIPNQAGRIKL